MLKIPKGYDSVSKTFRLPVELVEEMEKLACNNKISLNKLVVQCLIYAMDNIENEKPNEK
jgi:predicted HicB family RNase H-like nuclease